MGVTILTGDVLAMLATLDDESVDCVVTSPPYWGLRDYEVDGQIGLELTLAEHLEVMVRVFDEIKRVLKPTGTVWLNYGDCYATSPNGRSAADTKALGDDDRTFRDKPFSTIQGNLKPKDLCMIPNRLAIALQNAGWWVRAECVWAKPNPMPESVKDRPATSHEKIWLLTKTAKYFYDADAVRVPAQQSSIDRWAQDIDAQSGSTRANGGRKTNGNMKAVGGPRRKNENANSFRGGSYVGGQPSPRSAVGNQPGTGDRSLRNYEPAPIEVWPMATRPFKDAHFATFPPELAERCIKAGCPAGGVVLDPSGGAGTTGLVADRLQRDCILIELNPEYVELARERIDADAGMFSPISDTEIDK